MRSAFLCPVCGLPLDREARVCRCAGGHCYDLAKSGYVNLLLPGGKHSKAPGDNKQMVEARRAFLGKDYYRPLADAVCECAAACLSSRACDSYVVLDTGCGEGYYTAAVRESLSARGLSVTMQGIDISKSAVEKAARRDRDTHYAVASAFHLPVAEASCALMLNLFAPYCSQEAMRVIQPGGYLLMVVPGERHLMELKAAVYEHPYANETPEESLEGFILTDSRRVIYPMALSCTQDIENLFLMTPYAYKTSPEDAGKLRQLQQLQVTADFQLQVYQRQ